MDPAEIRMKNFPTQFPFQQTLVHSVDSGDYVTGLNKAMEVADYKGFEKRKRESASKGKLRGIGLCSYFEACGIAPSPVVMMLGCGLGYDIYGYAISSATPFMLIYIFGPRIADLLPKGATLAQFVEIGRASCRERV